MEVVIHRLLESPQMPTWSCMLSNTTQQVISVVKVQFTTCFLMLNSKQHELQSMHGVRMATLDTTQRIHVRLINTFQTTNSCFQSFRLVTMEHRVHRKSLLLGRQRTFFQSVQVTTEVSVLLHPKVQPWTVVSNPIWSHLVKEFVLHGLKKPRMPLVQSVRLERTAILAPCIWN